MAMTIGHLIKNESYGQGRIQRGAERALAPPLKAGKINGERVKPASRYTIFNVKPPLAPPLAKPWIRPCIWLSSSLQNMAPFQGIFCLSAPRQLYGLCKL